MILPVTITDIATEVGANRIKVHYALRRARVKPVGRAGSTRLFHPSAIEVARAYVAHRATMREADETDT